MFCSSLWLYSRETICEAVHCALDRYIDPSFELTPIITTGKHIITEITDHRITGSTDRSSAMDPVSYTHLTLPTTPYV